MMPRGWGFKAQVGMTYLYVQVWPFNWEFQTSLMAPYQWGVGFWITKEKWS